MGRSAHPLVRAAAIATLAIAFGACGYFNTMYNAQRRFGDAQRLDRSGDRTAAAVAYQDAIARAAASYRGHPEGRWADDALLLIGRARFALGEYDAARAAFVALLATVPDADMTAMAHAHVGAASTALGDAHAGMAHLDTAVAISDRADLAAFTRLWRARARFSAGEHDAAWADLDAAAERDGESSIDVHMEVLHRAVEAGDTLRQRAASSRLFRMEPAASMADSIGTLLRATADAAGPAFARSLLADVDRAPWPPPQREPLALARIAFAAESGDTAAAIDDARAVAARASAGTANRARVFAARLELASTDSIERLDGVRALLLPAIGDGDARNLLHWLRTLEVLLARAESGEEPVALFVAAEIARDEIVAPRIARELFLAYADLVPDAIWAPKALLAAASLSAGTGDADAIVARFHASSHNVYVKAMSGSADAEEFTIAEQRLGRTMAALRDAALAEAGARDVRVASAIARMDSIDARVRADSIAVICGVFLDSIAPTGIRADSARAACARADTVRMRTVLQIDTVMLLDSLRIRADSLRKRGIRIDTSTIGAG